jgi:hypothetical protein
MIKSIIKLGAIPFLILGLAFNTSCKKDEVVKPNEPEVEEFFDCTICIPYTGQWDWVSSTGGFAGEHISAEEVDYTQRIEIEEKTIKWFENDVDIYS